MAEKMVAYYCRRMAGRPELSDLSQIAYIALLEKEDERIVRAYDEGWLPFLLRAIIKRQVFTDHSPWRDLFRKYGIRAEEINEDVQGIPDL